MERFNWTIKETRRIWNKVSTDMGKHSVMTGQLREMLKYFRNPAAENRTKQSKRSAITRSLVTLDQYVITYKYYKRKWMGKILFRIVGIFKTCETSESHSCADQGFSLHMIW